MAQLFSENRLQSSKHSCVYSEQDPTATGCQDEGASTEPDFQKWEASSVVLKNDTFVLIANEESQDHPDELAALLSHCHSEKQAENWRDLSCFSLKERKWEITLGFVK